MIVLLSVGQAMLDQSRDVSLVGGGEVTVLPQGIDVEAMRTGGIGSMFFGVDRARFLVRQVFGGVRHQDLVRTVSPTVEGKLLYLQRGNRVLPVRAGGEIPSRAASVGSGMNLIAGSWKDLPADSAYLAPSSQQLYDELDRFHIPPLADSTWGEWHYFNIVPSETEWWYITYLVGGEIPPDQHNPAAAGRWGGQLLVTHRQADGEYQRFLLREPSQRVQLDTTRADLMVGGSSVTQRDGVYHLIGGASGSAGTVRIDVILQPASNRYFPPVELRSDEFVSGYVVPGLVAHASGSICVAGRCRKFHQVPAYHDHNWGVWRDVTWEWGAGQGKRLAVLYGGVYGPERNQSEASAVRSPFFLTLEDSLGVKQVLRFNTIHYTGSRPARGRPGFTAPSRFELVATRDQDSLRLAVEVEDALATPSNAEGFRRAFLQMRGHFNLRGRVLGETVSDSGAGFFETYVSPR
ncbi:MAG: hypothetical protein ACJ8AV_15005 [Gemmatimonadales bacterium]